MVDWFGGGFWGTEPFASAVRFLGEDGRDALRRLWEAEWVERQENRRFAALALELARQTGDEKLLRLVTNAIATDDTGRLVVETPGALMSPAWSVHWGSASDAELFERVQHRADSWRRVWACLAGANVHVLTRLAFQPSDGAVRIRAEIVDADGRTKVGSGVGPLPLGLPLPKRPVISPLPTRDPSKKEEYLDAVGRFAGSGTSIVVVEPFPRRGRQDPDLLPLLLESRRQLPAGRRAAQAVVRAQLKEAWTIVRTKRANRSPQRLRLDMYRRHLCAWLLMNGWNELRKVGRLRAARVLFATKGPVNPAFPEAVDTSRYADEGKRLIESWRAIGTP